MRKFENAKIAGMPPGGIILCRAGAQRSHWARPASPSAFPERERGGHKARPYGSKD